MPTHPSGFEYEAHYRGVSHDLYITDDAASFDETGGGTEAVEAIRAIDDSGNVLDIEIFGHGNSNWMDIVPLHTGYEGCEGIPVHEGIMTIPKIDLLKIVSEQLGI